MLFSSYPYLHNPLTGICPGPTLAGTGNRVDRLIGTVSVNIRKHCGAGQVGAAGVQPRLRESQRAAQPLL